MTAKHILQMVKRISLSSIICLLVFGCATFGQLSLRKQYLAVADQYNDIVSMFLAVYEEATPESKATYNEEIAPLLLGIADSLDAWRLALKNGDDHTEAMIKAVSAIENFNKAWEALK